MTTTESIYSIRTARVLRCLRKSLNISQEEVSDRIEVRRHILQGAENCKNIDFKMLCKIADTFNFQIEDFRNGYLDSLPNANNRGFKNSQSAIEDAKISMRIFAPLENAFSKKYSNQALFNFHKQQGVDLDYRYHLENRISPNISEAMLPYLNDLDQIISLNPRNILHGKMYDDYKNAKNRKTLLKKIVHNANRYSTNSKTTLSGPNELLIERNPTPEARRASNYNLSYILSVLQIKGDAVFQVLEQTPSRTRALVL